MQRERTKRGMSKGHNCRTRRIKCDEQQPHCKRCVKSDLQCEGYERRHVFVEVTPQLKGKHKEASSRRSTTGKPEAVSYPARNVFVSAPPPPLQTITSQHTLSVPAEVPLSGFQEDIQSTFLITRLFSGNAPQAAWLSQHLRADDSPTPKASMRALSTIYFGRMHRDETLVSQGRALYITALRHLAEDLKDTETARSLAVLRSADVLKFFELISFSSREGWLNHTGGIARFIELRGPYSFQDPASRLHLEENKSVIIIECIIRHKHCFLATNDKWKTVPWQHDPHNKSAMMYLYDIFADIPCLIADADALGACVKAGAAAADIRARYLDLSKRISDCWKALYRWRVKWAEENLDVCVEIPGESLFNTRLEYTSLDIARELTTYDVILMLLYRVGARVLRERFASALSALHRDLKRPIELTRSPLMYPGEAKDEQSIAVEVCRTLEYYLLGDNKGVGAFYVLFPINVAYHALEKGSRIAIWLEGIMTNITETKGFGIGRRLMGDAAAAQSTVDPSL